jgi:hypothetical protein
LSVRGESAPENLDAYDFVLRALPHARKLWPTGAKIAIPLLQHVLKLDPNYAAAHARTQALAQGLGVRATLEGPTSEHEHDGWRADQSGIRYGSDAPTL